jgi:hypothetical protein
LTTEANKKRKSMLTFQIKEHSDSAPQAQLEKCVSSCGVP